MERVFDSKNISFVKISEDFINDYLEMINDNEGVAQYIGHRQTPFSVEEELDFIRGKIEVNAVIFSMIENCSGEFIGNIELMDIKDRCGELGIVITARKQDMHFGTEAIKRMLEYGFNVLDLKRITLKVYPKNERAIHVYENCGFEKYDATDEDICMEVIKNYMTESLIAPCGMNCGLCIAYQFKEKDLNKKGFHRTYCPGCIPRGKNCKHFGDRCGLLGKGKVRFCFECEDYPCERLKALDKRYSTKYHMSMIENLNNIRDNEIEGFLKNEEEKWKCTKCGGTICCHNGLCMNCDFDTLLRNKKYRWNE